MSSSVAIWMDGKASYYEVKGMFLDSILLENFREMELAIARSEENGSYTTNL